MNAQSDHPELLVDFADGELSPEETTLVEEHLAVCADCRHALATFQSSLGLARQVWVEDEASLRGFRPQRPPATYRLRPALVGAIAASFVLVLTASLIWMLTDHRGSVPSPVADQELPAELQDRIDREGIAAQMLVTANLLAGQPGGEESAQERYADILSIYRDTHAAQQVPALHTPGVRRNPT